MAGRLLQIRDLTTGFVTEKGIVKATDKVSLQLKQGQTLCLVGESGSGKSVTALSIMRLIDYAGGMVLEGKIEFQGQDLAKMDQNNLRQIRGNKIAMIFQDPMSALNPVFTIGDQIAESLRLHRGLSDSEAWQEAVELLKLVGIPDPALRAKQYPHELSGGMSQRVVIAIALACRPELLIADEPTTALDVTVQAQILDLLRKLKDEIGMSIILITHDMGVAAEMADRIAVMYAGVIVEEGTVQEIFENPSHPYTVGLLQSIPGLEGDRGKELFTIQGNIPGLGQIPYGCRFHPRCPHVKDRCRSKEPCDFWITDDHRTACWLFEDKNVNKQDRPIKEGHV
ncbi:ABC transporter ATP-binding protein [Paenibacillus motobuensis]|uniref:ABC transporter ATP-binding protein n=1 Tax=Paenibacillus motobuensis TaxID=295324 RepID=A0ABP3IEP9_9BACL